MCSQFSFRRGDIQLRVSFKTAGDGTLEAEYVAAELADAQLFSMTLNLLLRLIFGR